MTQTNFFTVTNLLLFCKQEAESLYTDMVLVRLISNQEAELAETVLRALTTSHNAAWSGNELCWGFRCKKSGRHGESRQKLGGNVFKHDNAKKQSIVETKDQQLLWYLHSSIPSVIESDTKLFRYNNVPKVPLWLLGCLCNRFTVMVTTMLPFRMRFSMACHSLASNAPSNSLQWHTPHLHNEQPNHLSWDAWCDSCTETVHCYQNPVAKKLISWPGRKRGLRILWEFCLKDTWMGLIEMNP